MHGIGIIPYHHRKKKKKKQAIAMCFESRAALFVRLLYLDS